MFCSKSGHYLIKCLSNSCFFIFLKESSYQVLTRFIKSWTKDTFLFTSKLFNFAQSPFLPKLVRRRLFSSTILIAYKHLHLHFIVKFFGEERGTITITTITPKINKERKFLRKLYEYCMNGISFL